MIKYLGIDIGGTAVKMGIITEKGDILYKADYNVAFDDYETPILTTTLSSTDLFLQKSQTDLAEIAGIGVSATGQIDIVTGTVIGTAGHIKNWVGTAIKEAFEEKYHKKTTVLNDGNAAVIGEQWMGRAKGYKNVVAVTIGTGVGGGIIADSKVLNGSKGIAGEIGHFSIHTQGLPCTCGNHGCYERYASTTALVKMVRERYQKLPDTKVNGKVIFDILKSGDSELETIVTEWMDHIVIGLVNLVHIFNPDIILIGGGVSRQEELFIQKVREKVLKNVMPRFAENLKIESAKLLNDAGIIGAAAAIIQDLEL